MTHHLTLIGLGLIGSSIARAAKAKYRVIGIDTNEVSVAYALKHQLIDATAATAQEAVQSADIVIIASPTPTLAGICREIAPALKSSALVMDVGSVKRQALAIMIEQLPAHALIVPAHPIAGSEQSGVAAGRADLLEKKRVIITPAAPLDVPQLQRINAFWESLGARVEAMPAEMHDVIYGYVSHLPQRLAYAAKEVVEESDSLRKFLRISHSDRALWSDIFCANQDVLSTATNRYLDAIAHIKRELAAAPDDAPVVAEQGDVGMLFARIAASCLITTVMEAEKNAGVPFARFAGTGFADFTSPATSAPEEDLALISSHHKTLVAMLTSYENTLRSQ